MPRKYFGAAYSFKLNRGPKSVDLHLSPFKASQLATALLKYTSQAFQAIQSGNQLNDIQPVEITMHDAKKTQAGKFQVTATCKA